MSNAVNADNIPKKQGKAAQIVLSVLIFAGFVALLFIPKAAFYDEPLWALVLDLFKGNFLGSVGLKAALGFYVAFYALLLVCTIVSFCVKRGAAAGLNFLKTLLGLAATALFVYMLYRDGVPVAGILLSDSTFVAINSTVFMLAFGLLALLVLSFATYKAFAFVKLLFLVLAGGYFAFAGKYYVDLFNLSDLLFGSPFFLSGVAGSIAGILFRVLAWAIVVNAVLALLALAIPRTGVLDLIRSIVMLLLSAAAVVVLGLYDSFSSLLSVDYLGTLSAAGLSLLQLIAAIVVFALLCKHKRARRQAAEAQAAAEAAAQPYPFATVGENGQMEFTEAAPEAPAEPAPAEEAPAANKAFEDAAQISFDDLNAAAEDAGEYESIIRDQPPEEAPATEEQAEEKPFDFEQAQYDGNFNRDYTDYARQQESAQAQAQAQPQAQQAPYGYGEFERPQAPYAQTYAPQGGYSPNGYVPDAFLNSLTTAERDEFTRLFISRIYGENRRLPVYRVGEDNREFFTKIFVFMGRYRNVISDSLLEKIYNYSNIIR